MSFPLSLGRLRPLGATLLAVAVIVIASGFGGDPPALGAAGSPPARSGGFVVRPVVASRAAVEAAAPRFAAGDLLGQYEERLASAFPRHFGGLYVGRNGDVVVATVGDSGALRELASRGFSSLEQRWSRPGLSRANVARDDAGGRAVTSGRMPDSLGGLSFARARIPFDRLVTLKADILANAQLRRDGVTGAGLEVQRDQVSVTTTNSAVGAILTRLYGSAVDVSAVRSSTLDASRTNDNAPWNGGDLILDTAGDMCSLGFGVTDSVTGDSYSFTAGHCGSAKWYNLSRTSTAYTAGNLVGSTVAGSVSKSVVDAQLISDNSSCIVWGASGTRYFITGAAEAPVGASVLAEGAVGGNIPGVVQVTDWSGTIGSESLSDIDLTTAVTDLGDSGGPVVYPTIFGPLAEGTIVGTLSYENGTTLGVVEEFDAELWDYSAMLGDPLVTNVSTNGTSC